jgi:hypothetical protein
MGSVLTITNRSNAEIDKAARQAAKAMCSSSSRRALHYFTQPGSVELADRKAHLVYHAEARGRSPSWGYAQLEDQRSWARCIFDKFRGIDFDGRKRLTAAEWKTFQKAEAEFDKERSRHVALFLETPALIRAKSGDNLAPDAHWRSPITLTKDTALPQLRTYAVQFWPRVFPLLATPRIAKAAWKSNMTLRALVDSCPKMTELIKLAATYPHFEPPAGVTAEEARQLRVRAGLGALLNQHAMARAVEKKMLEIVGEPACGDLNATLGTLGTQHGIGAALLRDMLADTRLLNNRMPGLLAALFDKVSNIEEAFQLATTLPWDYNWSLSKLLKHPGVKEKVVAACRAAFDAEVRPDPSSDPPKLISTQLRPFFTGQKNPANASPPNDGPMSRTARQIIWEDEVLRKRLEAHIAQKHVGYEWLLQSHTNPNVRRALSNI